MKTCKKCGGKEFYADGKCAACVRQRAKKWYESNKYRAKEYKRQHYLKNKEKQLSIARTKRAANIATVREMERNRSALNRKKNSEKVKRNAAKYRELNREKLRAYEKQRRESQVEKVRAARKKWQSEHPDQCRIHCKNRHARKKHNGGSLSNDIAKKLMVLQKGKCAACLVSLKDTGYHLDHVVPLSLGGENADGNIQLLCPTCNHKKGAKNPVEFMQSKGFLL